MTTPALATATILLAASSAFGFAPKPGTEKRPTALSGTSFQVATRPADRFWQAWIGAEIGAVEQVRWNPHTSLPSRIYPSELELAPGERLRDWLGSTLLSPADDFETLSHHTDIRGLEIIAGAMWDTRLALGTEAADDIFHFARYLKAKKMDVYALDVLVTDDDGNLDNGTPNGSRIHQAFGHHGLLDPLDITLDVPSPPDPVSPGDAILWQVELTNGESWDQQVDLWVEAGVFVVDIDSDLVLAPGTATVSVSGTVPAGAPLGPLSAATDRRTG